MFSQQQQQQQLQQQQLQQQQLLQLQQLLQQAPPQAPLPMAVSRGFPQQQPQQQLLNLQATTLLNGSMLQRALLLQQLQGLDQFAMPPATYDSAGLTMPTAAMGGLRSYNLATPNLTAPSITPPQLGPPNLQQFFPQATRQSLLGPPPVGVPMNPSQLSLSGRNPQKQTRTYSSTTLNRKTMPVEDGADPLEGSEEAEEPRTDTPEDRDSPPCPDGTLSEKRTPTPELEPCEMTEPLAKRSRSSEMPTEKGPARLSQAKVALRARRTVPKQTQTPELLPELPGARELPRFQPRVLQIQAQVQPQTPRQMPPADTQVPLKVQKQAQTQTSLEHLVPLQKETEPQKQVQCQGRARPPKQGQLQPQAQTEACPQVPDRDPPPRGQMQEQSLEQPSSQVPVQPPGQTQGQPETQPQGLEPTPERAPVPVDATAPGTLPNVMAEAGGGVEEASPEPAGAQVKVAGSQESPAGGLHMGECENRSREMLGMWGAGGSLKVTILQSSDSRAFHTTPLTPVPRPSDSSSATPAAAGTPSKQGLHFFCYICKASCSGQQEFQDHMLEAQHLQRLVELQQMNQVCLLSLLPTPRDTLEKDEEEPPLRRWCNTCQVYYVGDLIQHRRTQDHKVAKQSLRPFCTICSRYFKTPRKFVEHVKSQGHKDKAKELKMLEKEMAGQDEDHFITVDAVGCFEGDEEEEEEEEDDEEEEVEVEEELCKQVKYKDGEKEEQKGSDTYNPNTACGVDFLVPVMGYICRVCHKFCHRKSGGRLSHCKSLAHLENLQKYKAAESSCSTSRPVSRQCAINARNALTALFTSGVGSARAPTQSSTQDKAKPFTRMASRSSNPLPLPRRSSRLKT